jgi:DNA ligase (NAD+)
LIENPADFYTLTKNSFFRWKEWRKNLHRISLQELKNQRNSFEKVLYGIGIKHVGETVAKKLVKNFPTIEELKMLLLKNFVR